jgi:hypothetical protein
MKDIDKLVKNLKEIIEVLEANKISDMHISVPQEGVEEMPDVRHFYIADVSNILENGFGTKYPLFIKDRNDPHHGLIINYAIMKEFLYRDDVTIRISFAFKDGGGACAVFKPSNVMVHVGWTTITGENEDGTVVEIRARNWKKLCSARVTIRKIHESEE